ncbi:MAG: XrtB/PEP-CTERM-associated transcriptional regulator EpsA [Methylophilaceae bacterium]
MEIDNQLVEKIFGAIRSSYKIDKHVDFFIWLQGAIGEVLPHDMLLASWGEFNQSSKKNGLSYDVASNVSEVSTQVIMDAADKFDGFMRHLHTLWGENNQRWYILNSLDDQGLAGQIQAPFPSELKPFHSMLVYGVSDVRGSSECLYVFLSKDITFSVQNSVMGLVMPHIDSTLRRIQHIEITEVPEGVVIDPNVAAGLSQRELEILYWVKVGKTNQEIGEILFISQNTVKSHLKRIFGKLNVSTRAQAVGKFLN